MVLAKWNCGATIPPLGAKRGAFNFWICGSGLKAWCCVAVAVLVPVVLVIVSYMSLTFPRYERARVHPRYKTVQDMILGGPTLPFYSAKLFLHFIKLFLWVQPRRFIDPRMCL